MVKLGSPAHDFSLPDTNGKNVNLSDFDSDALVVIFTCNHCPYAKAVEDRLILLGNDYQGQTDFVLISSNEIENFPDDSPEKMVDLIQDYKIPFPYLFDDTQEVAKAYNAACTPDFSVFNGQMECVYRGQLDDSRPGNSIPVTGQDIRHVLDCILEDKVFEMVQKPSMGCNIKWK